MIRVRLALTVDSETKRFAAISGFDWPRASSRSTPSSRSVRSEPSGLPGCTEVGPTVGRSRSIEASSLVATAGESTDSPRWTA